MTSRHTPPALGSILGVWAHPDDEAYLSAGLMALARRSGHRVAVLTATAGEHGISDPERVPPARMARIRRLELRASLMALGVREHHVAGHPDGGCASIPLDEGAALVRRWMRRVRPDTIVTFGPDGMTGHDDHRAVSAWVQRAWEDAGRPCRLLHATVTHDFHREWGAWNTRLGLWGGEPPSTDRADLSVVVDCDDDLLDVKLAALAAHASQTTPLLDAMGEAAYRRWWATEAFVDAARPTTTASRSRDLAGVP